MALRVVTWNLKGSDGPDLDGVAARLRDLAPDIVALQEVQRHQARTLARLLGARSLRWSFKHWPVRTRSEGMAVVGVTVAARVRARALSFRWRPWTWRRRIAQVARLPLPADGAGPAPSAARARGGAARRGGLTLVNLHLSTEREEERRAAEVATVLATVGAAGTAQTRALVVAGDLNDHPGSPVLARLAAAGLRDAWAEAHPEAHPEAAGRAGVAGATNWPGWRPGTDRAPSKRIDFVLVSAGLVVVDATVPAVGDGGFDAFRRLSDHLPVAVTLRAGPTASA